MNHSVKSPYMGGEVEIGTGPKGEVANRELIEQSTRLQKRLYKVTEGVYNLVGVGLANSTMIEADEGLIIIDTGDCIEQSQEHLLQFRKVTEKPVKAIIYTHSHYAFGTTTYIPDGQSGSMEIWAHEDVHDGVTSYMAELGPSFARRASIQFGLFVPKEGPDAPPNEGLGLYLLDLEKGVTSGYIKPTRTIRGEQEATIAGIRFRFASYASDADDTIVIWMPEKRVAINNHLWPTFANIYTLRGAPYRRPDEWIGGIDYMRRLDVEHLVGVHGAPMSGRDKIHSALTEYRDAIQFIYDQTVRGLNVGLSPDELVESVKLPDKLLNSPYNRQVYGEVPFYIRQIYNGIMGWFGNDTATLHRLPLSVEAQKIVSGFGGSEKVVSEIRTALESREYCWAAQLASYLLRLDPENKEFKQLKADALRHLGQVTTAANTRNFYLTEARELEGKINTKRPAFQIATVDRIMQTAPGTFVKALQVRLNPDKSSDINRRLGIRFTDLKKDYVLEVRNGIAEFLENDIQETDLWIALPRLNWAEMVCHLYEGERSRFFSILSEKSETNGSLKDIEAFFNLFD